MVQRTKPKLKPEIIKASHVLKHLPLEDYSWDRPQILKINEVRWSKPEQALVAVISRIDYFSPGFRRGILQAICEISADEGVHFIILMGIVRKDFFKDILKRRIAEAKMHIESQRTDALHRGQKIAGILEKDIREMVTVNIVNEAAQALAAMLPKIKKPHAPGEYIRYYISTSKRYDGDIGERIAHRLQELRHMDIRKYHPGSIRTELKKSDIVFWTLGEMKSRIPGQFVSQAIEKIIRDKESETSR